MTAGMSIRTEVCQIIGKDSRCHIIERKNLQMDFLWSGGRLTKIQATTRPENLWPEVWSKMGKAAQKKEKQERANEEPELDNA